jgi:hypothetical protein
MKLAVRKDVGSVPGGGFHYMLHPMKMQSDQEAEIFNLMGHTIIEVDEERGEGLLKSAIAALNHQIDVACLTEEAIKEQRA